MSVNKINKKGRFGKYGGEYITETLMNAVNKIKEKELKYKNYPDFVKKLEDL